jgi:hypothetical protein
MNNGAQRVDALDLGLWDGIPSQTSSGDRRSLLAVQRAVAKKHGEYTYLEIGSHLGGSLQPYLVDDRCKRIYSIDPRPQQQPDDRAAGFIAYYPENSTKKMLELLGSTGYGDVAKIDCFDLDASKVDPGSVTHRPHIAFIDGEHTRSAVVSDFKFCMRVLSSDGVALFHDFSIIYPTLREIFAELDNQNRAYVPVKLEGEVFAIIFDPDLPASDPFLSFMLGRHKYFWASYGTSVWLKKWLPGPVVTLLRRAWRWFRTPPA